MSRRSVSSFHQQPSRDPGLRPALQRSRYPRQRSDRPELEAQIFPISAQRGTEILVPADQVARLRITMAEGGLPRGGSIGYESSTRTNRSVHRISCRTSTICAPSKASSHGPSPRSARSRGRASTCASGRELFSREKQEPSASIVIKTRGAERLSKGQVAAVQHLVAAPCPACGRAASRSSTARAICWRRPRTSGARRSVDGPSNSEEMRINYENRQARAIEEMLERSVGPGKVARRGPCRYGFRPRDDELRELRPRRPSRPLDANRPTSRATAATAATRRSPLPTIFPDAQATRAAAPARARRTAATTRRPTTNTKTVTSQVREGGIVKKLSVAVLVDGLYTAGADGAKTYQPRSPEELKQLDTLVRTAIGFNAERGDSVQVVNLRFATPEDPATPHPMASSA